MFTGLPAHVSALSGPAARTGIRPVPHRRPPWSSGDRGRESRCLSAAGIRLLGILSRRWVSAPLAIGLPGFPGPGPRRGFRVPRTRDTAGVGAPYTPRPAVFMRPAMGLRSPLAASSNGQALPPGSSSRLSRALLYEASSGVHSRSPVRPSPRPVAPPDGTGALGLLPQAPHLQQAGPVNARRGGDRSRTLIGNYAPGITGLQPASSLNMRDLASHPIRSRSARSAASR